MLKNSLKKITSLILVIAIVFTSFIITPSEEYSAITMDTNAYTFYLQNKKNNKTCIVFKDGYLIFCTRAKPASTYSIRSTETSSDDMFTATTSKLTNMRGMYGTTWRSFAWDVTFVGGGKSLTVTVDKSGGYMKPLTVEAYGDDGYVYQIYGTKYADLKALAEKHFKPEADVIFKQPSFMIYLNAIIGISPEGTTTCNGWIEEDINNNTWKLFGKYYRCNNSSDLKELKEIFESGADSFDSYTNIECPVTNGTLKVVYNKNGGYTPYDPDGNGVIGSNVYYLWQSVEIYDPSVFKLSKTGYYIPDNNQWVTKPSSGCVASGISSSKTYKTSDLNTNIVYGDCAVELYANWQPNPYKIVYYLNDGTEFEIGTTHCTYGETVTITGPLGYSRPGYEFMGWSTTKDGAVEYREHDTVSSLTTEYNGTVKLYAVWQPLDILVYTHDNGGTGGQGLFYERFGKCFSLNKTPYISAISSIKVPTREGYNFLGYYDGYNGLGSQVVTPGGKFNVEPTHFTKPSTIYAYWEAKTAKVLFDKQGGTDGTDSVTATYGKDMPYAEPPARDGYEFMGYYTGKNGTGTQYYTKYMASARKCDFEGDKVLYAYWVDAIDPTTRIATSAYTWTNDANGIRVICYAEDMGAGLKSVTLYQGLTEVYSKTGMSDDSKTTEYEFTYVHFDEGVHTYRLVATDTNGRTSEAIATVFYDVTAPTGNVEELDDSNFANFYAFAFASDLNVISPFSAFSRLRACMLDVVAMPRQSYVIEDTHNSYQKIPFTNLLE